MEGALNYNEQKVKKRTAECIHAANYLPDANQLSYHQKLAGLEVRNSLNERATTKTLHVSLNFDPSENLSKEKFIKIAETYMDKIGFGDQPYLVYHHHDAGHPHIHIVTTTIKQDGSRINTHNIGKNQSEVARKEIEQLFHLVKAGKNEIKAVQTIHPADIQKALYGKNETRRSISNIVTAVISQYKFCSLPEFNAALRQFNVIADRGSEEGRIYKSGGLIYRLLDEQGNKIGVPIKASLIPSKPTLSKLILLFEKNESRKEAHREILKTAINKVINQQPDSLMDFKELMSQQKIFVLLRLSADGKPYGITFVDNISKCVFNGSDLGKQYSVAALTGRIHRAGMDSSTKESPLTPGRMLRPGNDKLYKNVLIEKQISSASLSKQADDGLGDKLTESKTFNENIPFQLRRKKKRKKKNDL